MEKAKYLLLAIVCLAFAGCMDGDWDEPSTTPSPWGNNSIEETNVITIAQLKDKYSSVFNASVDQAVKVDEDLQIKAWVTGNDVTGNIYQQISVQDETGAILIGISQGGLNGYLPIGQQILVNLKDLYVGGYRKQCQIGAPYNSGIGRMDKFTWQEHFKIIGNIDTAKVNSLITDFSASNVVVRTSTYADFAAMPMPTGKVNITGIFTRFNNTWQILLRSDKDIQPAE